MVLVLIITCLITPVRLAFLDTYETESLTWIIIQWIIDFLFLMDIIIIFNSAYYDEYFQIIEDRKQIAKEYLTGWFMVDTLAIIPFDVILNATDFNQLIKFARIGRLYKLVKLTRLLRVFKIMKDKGKFLKFFTDLLKVGLGFERLFFFILLFLIMSHIVTCLWIMIPMFVSEEG